MYFVALIKAIYITVGGTSMAYNYASTSMAYNYASVRVCVFFEIALFDSKLFF